MAKKIVKTTIRQKPGFFEKLGSNFAGSFAGLALFLLSFYILYSNESRSVETEAVLEEVLQTVTPMHDGQSTEYYNGQLVLVTGRLNAGFLSDPVYPVSLPCVKLSRFVEMYQWVEHTEVKEYEERNEIKKETTYTYNAEWSGGIHRSRDFAEELGHQNPTEMPVSDLHLTSNQVRVNGFELNKSLIDKINWFSDLLNLPDADTLDVEILEKHYYHARDPYSPDVGDIRVSFKYAGIAGETSAAPQDLVTIIAKNAAGLLVPYYIRSSGVELLHRGAKSAEEIIASEKQSNVTLTWGLRFAGWVLMYVGLSIMTKIVKTLFGWIPIFGSIVSASVTMFNISLSLSLALLTIAVGWLRARPILSVTVAIVSLIPWIISKMRATTILSYKSR